LHIASQKYKTFLYSNNLKNQIDNGNIAIVVVDMGYIRCNEVRNPEWRIDNISISPPAKNMFLHEEIPAHDLLR